MTYNSQQRRELKQLLTEFYSANPPLFQGEIAQKLTELGWKSPKGDVISQSTVSVWARKLNVGRRLKPFTKGENRIARKAVLPTLQEQGRNIIKSIEVGRIADRAALIELIMQTNLPAKSKLDCVRALVNQ